MLPKLHCCAYTQLLLSPSSPSRNPLHSIIENLVNVPDKQSRLDTTFTEVDVRLIIEAGHLPNVVLGHLVRPLHIALVQHNTPQQHASGILPCHDLG